MTTQTTGRVPTPGDVVARRIPARLPYDRHAWEEALLAATLPHYTAKLLGWTLAHFAPSGEFRAGNSKDAGYLAAAARLSAKQLRMGLAQLEQAGLIVRPPRAADDPGHALSRPFTLTLPSAAARTEPAHTGEGPS